MNRPNSEGPGVRREPVFEAGDLQVVPLDDTDASALSALFESCTDYFELVFGLPPGPAEVQSAFVALPEGSNYDDKLLLGVFDDGDELIGHVDLICDHPAPEAWTIGLLLLAPSARGRGVGGHVINALSSWVTASGGRELRIGVVGWNERAIAFLERVGFSVMERRPDVQSGVKSGTYLVLRRTLGVGYR